MAIGKRTCEAEKMRRGDQASCWGVTWTSTDGVTWTVTDPPTSGLDLGTWHEVESAPRSAWFRWDRRETELTQHRWRALRSGSPDLQIPSSTLRC